MKPELPDCVCAYPVPSHDAVRHNASALFDARLLLSDRSIDTFSRSRMDGMVRKERKRERESTRGKEPRGILERVLETDYENLHRLPALAKK